MRSRRCRPPSSGRRCGQRNLLIVASLCRRFSRWPLPVAPRCASAFGGARFVAGRDALRLVRRAFRELGRCGAVARLCLLHTRFRARQYASTVGASQSGGLPLSRSYAAVSRARHAASLPRTRLASHDLTDTHARRCAAGDRLVRRRDGAATGDPAAAGHRPAAGRSASRPSTAAAARRSRSSTSAATACLSCRHEVTSILS